MILDENEGFRVCKDCLIEKPYSEYYLRSNGRPQHRNCKACLLSKNRADSMSPEKRQKRLERQKQYQIDNREEILKYQKAYYQTKIGRAKSMLKTAQRRSSKFDKETDLDHDFIMDLLENDFCTVTGFKFDYSSTDDTKCNPFAPSIDRIDSNQGYLKSNVRLVIWQYNLMKGELSDDDIYLICKEVVNAREKILSR